MKQRTDHYSLAARVRMLYRKLWRVHMCRRGWHMFYDGWFGSAPPRLHHDKHGSLCYSSHCVHCGEYSQHNTGISRRGDK